METKAKIILNNGEFIAGDLKKFLNNIDDDAKIVINEKLEPITLFHLVEVQYVSEFLKIE